jgi:hypothetical protein
VNDFADLAMIGGERCTLEAVNPDVGGANGGDNSDQVHFASFEFRCDDEL